MDPIPVSIRAQRTTNPIRAIVDRLQIPKDAPKPVISLSIGDPAVFGNLNPHPSVIEAVSRSVSENKSNGYAPSFGTLNARKAVAQRYTTDLCKLTENDVILASGASGAIVLALQAMCNEGDNVLIPRPGFSLYRTVCDSDGVECRYYSLLVSVCQISLSTIHTCSQPDKQWEIDIPNLISQIDSRTRAIVINTPSNPCGAVYSKSHLQELCAALEPYGVPVISDEIYGLFVFFLSWRACGLFTHPCSLQLIWYFLRANSSLSLMRAARCHA